MGQKQTTIHKNLPDVEIQDDQENWLVKCLFFFAFIFFQKQKRSLRFLHIAKIPPVCIKMKYSSLQ